MKTKQNNLSGNFLTFVINNLSHTPDFILREHTLPYLASWLYENMKTSVFSKKQ